MAAQNLQYEGIEHYDVRRLSVPSEKTHSAIFTLAGSFSFCLYGDGRENCDRVGPAITKSRYLNTFLTAKRLEECWKGRLQRKWFRPTALQTTVVHCPHTAQHEIRMPGVFSVDLKVADS